MIAPLTIRVDATPFTGAGHAMRCGTLAESWQQLGGTVEVIGEIVIQFVRDRLENLAIPVRSESSNSDGVLVVDSYDPEIRRFPERGNSRVVVQVDDIGGPIPRQASVIWNPNAYSSADLYPAFDGALLAGREFVPVRSGLPDWSRQCRGTAVTLGSSALGQSLATSVMRALSESDEPVLLAGLPVAGARQVNPAAMWADFAGCCRMLCAAGITTWEAAVVGIPVVLLLTADNQLLIADWARTNGVPVVDLREHCGMEAEVIAASLGKARPLPRITPGAGRVAERLVAIWKKTRPR
jgi:spore coat polysaccharide biosynthesis predicted glycosyltransferase SpsG